MDISAKITRLLEKCEETEKGCRLYQGGLQNGYVIVYHDGRLLRAHKVLWEQLNGKLEPGKKLVNSCRNGNCLNPMHWHKAVGKPSSKQKFVPMTKEEKQYRKDNPYIPDPNKKGKFIDTRFICN